MKNTEQPYRSQQYIKHKLNVKIKNRFAFINPFLPFLSFGIISGLIVRD